MKREPYCSTCWLDMFSFLGIQHLMTRFERAGGYLWNLQDCLRHMEWQCGDTWGGSDEGTCPNVQYHKNNLYAYEIFVCIFGTLYASSIINIYIYIVLYNFTWTTRGQVGSLLQRWWYYHGPSMHFFGTVAAVQFKHLVVSKKWWPTLMAWGYWNLRWSRCQ